MKKRKMKVEVRPRAKREWSASEITEFDNLLKQVNYPNNVVQHRAKNALGVFKLRHGHAKCLAMALHLDAGGGLVAGPRAEVDHAKG